MATAKNSPDPAKKAAAKKATAKKAPAKKAAAQKTPAKRAVAKKAPAKKTAAKKVAPVDPLAAALAAALTPAKPPVQKKAARKASKPAAAPRRSSERLVFILAGAAVAVSLLAGGIVIAKRGDATADRCSESVAALRALITSQPDKEQLTSEQLEDAVKEQANLQTYCQYNEANQVLQSEVIPWLGITPPTSLPTATSGPTTTAGTTVPQG